MHVPVLVPTVAFAELRPAANIHGAAALGGDEVALLVDFSACVNAESSASVPAARRARALARRCPEAFAQKRFLNECARRGWGVGMGCIAGGAPWSCGAVG